MADIRHTARRTLLWVLAVIVAFLIGFGWQYVLAQRAANQLADARAQLALAEDEATLGAATLEAQRGSYEIARQLASDFYSALDRDARLVPDSASAAVQGMLAQRDAIITMLSRSDPASASILDRYFTQYRTALHGPQGVRPLSPAPAAPAAPDSMAAPDSAAGTP